MRFTLDSNLLVYSADKRNIRKQEAAIEIISRAMNNDCVILVQALAEFYHVVTRKRIMTKSDASSVVREWADSFILGNTANEDALLAAMIASVSGQFQFFDALLLATAGASRMCRYSQRGHGSRFKLERCGRCRRLLG